MLEAALAVVESVVGAVVVEVGEGQRVCSLLFCSDGVGKGVVVLLFLANSP